MKKSVFFLLSIFLVNVSLGQTERINVVSQQQAAPVRVLNTDEAGLTLVIEPRKWQELKRVVNAGDVFTQFDFVDANYVIEPGSPQIPYSVAVVGIPVGATVRYQVLETETVPIDAVNLIPFPTFVDGTRSKYEAKAAIDGENEPFPSEIVKIEEPGMFRDQHVVRILVAGLQYFPQQSRVIKYNRVVLRIEFSGGSRVTQSTPGPVSQTDDSLYKSALINYNQSMKWRRSGPQRKSSASLDRLSGFRNVEGTLYKFTVQEEGIYRIDGQLLQSHNINLNDINPATIRLFGNGGRELPRAPDAPRPGGLVENAIIVNDGGDGNFDPNDFILFYGRGVRGWSYDASEGDFSHYINHYTTENIYWLSFDGTEAGKRMPRVSSGPPSGESVETYQGLQFIEEELFNPLNSGLNFFGREFTTDPANRTQTYNLDLPNALTSGTAELRARFVSINSGTHSFQISVNGTSVGIRQIPGLSLELGQYLRLHAPALQPIEMANLLRPGSNELQITYSNTLSAGQANLDWVELLYPARTSAINDELAFTVPTPSGPTTYRVSNFTNDAIRLFDVTNFDDVAEIAGTVSNGTMTFTDQHETLQPKRYLALTPDRFKSVQSLERAEISDLRTEISGAEFIIITHEDFMNQAALLEGLRENLSPDNRLQTEVVTTREIYNNFSGGLMDPTAIRDFLKYAYENWSPRPGYVLLLGDGDYDYKNIVSRADMNWVPTYQSDELASGNTLRALGTRTSDSWFTYVSGNDDVMDLAIGRINAQSGEDAANAVNKIIAYETSPNYDVWRNTITIVGDDELNSGGQPDSRDVVHILQAEDLAENYVPESFNVRKIYLSEYPAVISASVGGKTKPAARNALIEQMNKGTLIVNYIGHGNSNQWTHELVFQRSDNAQVQNEGKLVFYVAATCDWALYDNPQRQSQAEELLLFENRGAIAILSSARLVFSNQNANFNRNYYRRLLPAEGIGATARIGDAFVLTRLNSVSTITNDEKFHIYGDPTLRLAVPRHEAVITSMVPDSIVALSTVDVAGEIRLDGQLWSDFNGTALVNTFDSKQFVEHVPETGSTQRYFLPGNSIFRGTVPVQDGRFSAKFIVPKDISYGGRLARISTYFWNEEESIDGAGAVDSIRVSRSSSTLSDANGPEIKLSFQGYENFTTGEIVGENVVLVAELADTVSGINIAGEIGHRITLSIDPEQETCLSRQNEFLGISSIDLTDQFRFNEGDHLRGRIEYPLHFPREVDVGGETVPCAGFGGEDRHTLVLKAWDNANNSSTASLEVLVAHEEGLVLEKVMNYPNPFRDETTFTFITNQEAEAEIKIYTISGQLIRTIEEPFAVRGFNMIEWNGRDADGDIPANGVYFYKLIVRSRGFDGIEQREKIGKLAIVR